MTGGWAGGGQAPPTCAGAATAAATTGASSLLGSAAEMLFAGSAGEEEVEDGGKDGAEWGSPSAAGDTVDMVDSSALEPLRSLPGVSLRSIRPDSQPAGG